MERDEKVFIYQVFPRVFGNMTRSCVKHGSLQQNGSGKFDDFTPAALKAIKDFGITHVWYTGVIEHATRTDYTVFGISKDYGAFVEVVTGVEGLIHVSFFSSFFSLPFLLHSQVLQALLLPQILLLIPFPNWFHYPLRLLLALHLMQVKKYK